MLMKVVPNEIYKVQSLTLSKDRVMSLLALMNKQEMAPKKSIPTAGPSKRQRKATATDTDTTSEDPDLQGQEHIAVLHTRVLEFLIPLKNGQQHDSDAIGLPFQLYSQDSSWRSNVSVLHCTKCML
ncbi:hypothetical protein RJT34_18386 [Clitoria ternatea]|uniref:Uncharacterized protein n=1 Tax=Clitoria ternatea TaxID=43366 RepID=A0AAN9JBF9_CLITE